MVKKLTGNAQTLAAGQHVFTGQKRAEAEGFKNTSKKWYEQTRSFDDGLEQIELGRKETEDIVANLKQMKPVVTESGDFVILHESGRKFRPTEHAVGQMGTWSGAGQWFPLNLLKGPSNARGEQLYARDRGDAQTMVDVFRNGFRRIDQEKPFLWRVRSDGTLRAMLTDKYAILDNRWFVESLKKLLPGGRLSHWRGDSDTIYGNVLIPDTIREDTDSDYGGMLSVGNSEIGERNLTSLPSIFRAICQNGCIWGQVKGHGIKVVHRGNIKMPELFKQIEENLKIQIPLLPQGIDILLAKRAFAWTGDMMPVFAQVVKEYRLSKPQATGLLKAHRVEAGQTPEFSKTLFNVINSVTRAGQELSNEQWFAFDKIGGELANFEITAWSSFKKKASTLTAKEVEAAFETAI